MRKLVVSWLLVFGTYCLANPSLKTPGFGTDFNTLECWQQVQAAKVAIESLETDYSAAIEAMYKRLQNNKAGITNAKISETFFKISALYHQLLPNLSNSPRIPPIVLDEFLPGVAIWAGKIGDLEKVWNLLARQLRFDGKKGDDFLSLEYFVARMVWVTNRYEDFKNSGAHYHEERLRKSAIRELDTFEDAYMKLNLIWDHDEFAVTEAPAGRSLLERLGHRGFECWDPSQGPIELRHVEFNAGRHFSFQELSPVDEWLALHLALEEPDEKLIGLGDRSVRQHFPFIRIIEGRVSMFGVSADLASIAPSIHLTKGQPVDRWGMRVREIKFTNPFVPEVDVAKAISQLSNSWQGLIDGSTRIDLSGTNMPIRFHDLPVEVTELVVPERARKFSGDLGNSYRIGKVIYKTKKATISEVEFNDGTNWAPVMLSAKHRTGKDLTQPLLIREISISKQEFNDLAKSVKEDD